jgi:hypothetical protein
MQHDLPLGLADEHRDPRAKMHRPLYGRPVTISIGVACDLGGSDLDIGP